MQRRTRRLLLLAGTLGVLVTTVVVGVASVPVVVEQPVVRVVLDTVVTLIALLLGFLVYGRFLLHRRIPDLLLAATLGLAGVLTAAFVVVPQLGDPTGRSSTVLVWAPLAGGLLVSASLAVAAWLPPGIRLKQNHPGRLLVLGCLGTAVLLGVVGWLLLPVLPGGATPQGRLGVRGAAEQVLAVLALLSAGLYAAAAMAFARRRDDLLAPDLAAAAVLLAFGRLNYALVPTLDPRWVFAGDLLRLLAYLLLLAASVEEIRRYWREQARAVVQQERHRLARTLHDGVAQEVSLLATQTRLLARGCPALSPAQLASAAERALDESRAAISALSGEDDEPLHRALLRLADDLEGRLAVRIRTDVEAVGALPRDVQEAFVRAAREATINAARHGGAHAVDVVLRADPEVRLVVTDDGRGFDADTHEPGFGLQTVRSRLEAVGARLRLEASPGQGTRVEVQRP